MEIRFIKKNEIDQLTKYIDTHWKNGHIFSKSNELLLWQHQYHQDEISFVGAFEKNNLVAILGFINSNDSTELQNSIWLAIWHSLNITENSGNGLKVLLWLMNTIKPKSIGVGAISNEALEIYKKLRFKTAKLNHFYHINREHPLIKLKPCTPHKNELIKVSKIDFSEFENHFEKLASQFYELYEPKKSLAYFKHRFFNHPVYQYQAWNLQNNHEHALIFTRTISHEDLKVVRIVDAVFSHPSLIANAAFEIAQIENAHYIDFLNYGIDLNLIHNHGMKLKEAGEIIPHYFEPFLNQNVEIDLAFKNDTKKTYLFFKADSDQDRPSLINNDI